MNDIISGALMMGYCVSGLFFVRFWHNSKDRLFLFFAIAFWLLAFQRILLFVLAADEAEFVALPYLVRLLAFLTILYAIYDKNRAPARAA